MCKLLILLEQRLRVESSELRAEVCRRRWSNIARLAPIEYRRDAEAEGSRRTDERLQGDGVGHERTRTEFSLSAVATTPSRELRPVRKVRVAYFCWKVNRKIFPSARECVASWADWPVPLNRSDLRSTGRTMEARVQLVYPIL